jgi:hypothetical protein
MLRQGLFFFVSEFVENVYSLGSNVNIIKLVCHYTINAVKTWTSYYFLSKQWYQRKQLTCITSYRDLRGRGGMISIDGKVGESSRHLLLTAISMTTQVAVRSR